jgi:hypothetical protein
MKTRRKFDMSYYYEEITNDEWEEMEIIIKDKVIIGMFTDFRINRSTIPDGKYAYDIRDGEDGFYSIEPLVKVGHAGTFVCDEEIIFPKRDNGDKYLEFNEKEECDYSFL